MEQAEFLRTKLLNEDGSFNRWIYASELHDLLKSDRLVRIKQRRGAAVRLKAVPSPSDSAVSPCMPTLGDLLSYVGLRKCTDEQRAKIDACRPQFKVTYGEVAACA
jgi:hypothetical protein